eukprot:scaffold92144_cov45-Prasinocladus_malaysianus.AAC.1
MDAVVILKICMVSLARGQLVHMISIMTSDCSFPIEPAALFFVHAPAGSRNVGQSRAIQSLRGITITCDCCVVWEPGPAAHDAAARTFIPIVRPGESDLAANKINARTGKDRPVLYGSEDIKMVPVHAQVVPQDKGYHSTRTG